MKKLKEIGIRSFLVVAILVLLCSSFTIFNVQQQPASQTAHALDEQTYTLYEEDFNDVTTKVSLNNGVNHSTTSSDGWIYSGKSNNGSAYIEKGKMYFLGSAYDVLYRDGGQTWGNYTLEADFCYTTQNAGWGGMLYNVHSDTKFQKVGIALSGSASANGMDGAGIWTNNDSTLNKLNMSTKGYTVPKNGEPFRMKVVVENKSADFYYSMLDGDGNMVGEYILLKSISNIPANAQTGSIGFMTNNGALASFWVDNIKCYSSSTVSFTENFDYPDQALTSNKENATTGLSYLIAGTAGSANISNGQLVFTGGSSHDALLLTASKNWTNYTVESDITFLNSSGWIGLLYRSVDLKSFQKAALNIANRSALNGKSTVNNDWYNNIEGIDKADYAGLYKDKIVLNQAFRLKVVVEEQTVTLYAATYDSTTGNLNEWDCVLSHTGRLAPEQNSGMIGFMANNLVKVAFDNVVVHRGTDRMIQEPTPANVADIYEPETGIVNPPVVVQSFNGTFPAIDEERPAVLMVEVDDSLNVLNASGEQVVSASSFIDTYRNALIPAFVINSQTQATAIASLIEEKNLIDCYVVASSDNASLVRSVRLANAVTKQVSGALIFDNLNDASARKIARAKVADNMSYVAISKTLVDQETARYFNVRQVAVWSMIETKADVYSAISCGYHGVVTTDSACVYDVYESISDVTVSGKPIIVAHRGANLKVGYPENTIIGYRAAIEEFKADAIEVDVRITSDGYLYLMHDDAVDRTTNGTGSGAGMTLSQIKALTVDEVAGKETTVPTFEELLQFLQGTDVVAYCHINTKTDKNVVSFSNLVKKYGCEDNVVFFISNTSARDYNSTTTTTATNSTYDLTDAPVVTSGIVYTSGNADILTDKTSDLFGVETMRGNLNLYNYQPLFYKYSDQGSNWGSESFYYQLSARGYVNIHSITNGQSVMDSVALTQSGAVGFLTDNLDLCDDYHYTLDVKNETLCLGEYVNLGADLILNVGKKATTCGLVQIDGDTLIKTADGYTLNSFGSATVVYYATRTTDGGSAYTVYSSPVTLTFNHAYVLQNEVPNDCETDGTKAHYTCDNCDKLFVFENEEYKVVADSDLIIPASHTLQDVEEKPATCTEDGYSAHKACSKCDYTEGKEIYTAGHEYVFNEQVDAGCETNGTKAHYTCDNCDKVFALEDDVYTEIDPSTLIIPASHDMQDVEEKPATCTEDGYSAHKACSKCDYTEGKEIYTAGHEYVFVEQVDAGCETNGTKEHYTCENCDKLFVFENEEYKVVTADDLIIPASHSYVFHEYVPATCTTDGVAEHYTCANCDKIFIERNSVYLEKNYEELIFPFGHVLVDEPEKPATCTEDGYSLHKKCQRCDYTEGKIILRAKHNMVNVDEKPATCTEEGYSWHRACTECDYTEGKMILPITHDYEYQQEVKKTCTTNGVAEHYTCSKCDKLFTKQGEVYTEVTADDLVLLAGHDMQAIEEEPASCTQDGYSAHQACSGCDYTVGKEPIPAHHRYYLVSEFPATTTSTGIKEHYACLGCDDKFLLVEGEYVKVEISEIIIEKLPSPNAGCAGQAMEIFGLLSMLCALVFVLKKNH